MDSAMVGMVVGILDTTFWPNFSIVGDLGSMCQRVSGSIAMTESQHAKSSNSTQGLLPVSSRPSFSIFRKMARQYFFIALSCCFNLVSLRRESRGPGRWPRRVLATFSFSHSFSECSIHPRGTGRSVSKASAIILKWQALSRRKVSSQRAFQSDSCT